MASTHFQEDCPHCTARSAGFEVVFQRRSRAVDNKYYIMAVCGVCDNSIIVKYQQPSSSGQLNLVGGNHEFPSQSLIITQIWPKAANLIPDDLPNNVENFFKQGLNNQKLQNWDAAGAMFRKSLDVATKIIDPELANKKLFSRIEALVKSHRLTPDIGIWAH